MSLMNSQCRVPPGFRFHPTEEELLHYYLRKKVLCEGIDLDVIREIDLNKVEPWDIQEACKIGSTPQNDWYFFSHKDKKYPTGCRTNRATAAGFWKATGRDKVIYSSSKRIGMRKTLVFYMGRAPHGLKSDWIMHEYRLEDDTDNSELNASSSAGEEDGWVVCRVFKKKNIFKTQDSPKNSSSVAEDDNTQMPHSSGDGDLDQILQYMRRACKMEAGHQHHDNNPSITHQNSSSSINIPNPNQRTENEQGITNWAALDRLVASHLNGQSESLSQLFDSFNDVQDQDLSLLHLPSYNRSFNNSAHDYNDVDLWNFTLPSSSIFATCQDHPSNLTKLP